MNKKIWLSSPHMGGTELDYINEAFKSNWIAPLGKNVDQFEYTLERYLGEGKIAALSSGTAAIHLALIMLGVKTGDIVIASSFTFSASVNPIVYQGATPLFIDSEEETWNMDPVLLKQSILDCLKKGKKPKAIIIVHLYGMPAKMNEITQIASEYDIPIVEDAAEALGSEYKNKKLGSIGDFGILSFNGNKIITTSGGGAIVCKSSEEVIKIKYLATQARDEAPHYQHSQIGYNYRMSNIIAGIGRGQMEVIEQRVKQKRGINKFYREILNKFSGISFQDEINSDYFSNYWLTCIIFHPSKTNKNRESLRKNLEKENIEARPLWKPMHLQPVFKNLKSYTNGISEYLFDNGLCLPSGSNLSDEDKERIAKTMVNYFNS